VLLECSAEYPAGFGGWLEPSSGLRSCIWVGKVFKIIDDRVAQSPLCGRGSCCSLWRRFIKDFSSLKWKSRYAVNAVVAKADTSIAVGPISHNDCRAHNSPALRPYKTVCFCGYQRAQCRKVFIFMNVSKHIRPRRISFLKCMHQSKACSHACPTVKYHEE
jgi:hypothetical protein